MVSILEPPLPRSYIGLRKIDWRIVLGLVALNTICLFFYRQFGYLADTYYRPPLLTFAEEASGGLAGLAVFPLIYLVAIRFPLLSPKWRIHLVVHLAAVCLISLIHTTLIALLRLFLFPLLGFIHENFGRLSDRYPMEFAHLFIYYWVMISLIYFFHEVRFAREREVRQAKLESSLAQAQLQNLRLQLEPHFLFNALNAISAALYEDPRVADEMIGRLGELLRQLLKEDHSQLIPLAREIELLQLYTRVMKARLEDRLAVCVAIDPLVETALVPQLILQPLVENAIRHGMDSNFEAHLEIHACQKKNSLCLTVRDHGAGIRDSQLLGMGIGLRNTLERLQGLFGTNHSFEIRNAEGGGAIVEICVPFQTSQQPENSLVMESVA